MTFTAALPVVTGGIAWNTFWIKPKEAAHGMYCVKQWVSDVHGLVSLWEYLLLCLSCSLFCNTLTSTKRTGTGFVQCVNVNINHPELLIFMHLSLYLEYFGLCHSLFCNALNSTNRSSTWYYTTFESKNKSVVISHVMLVETYFIQKKRIGCGIKHNITLSRSCDVRGLSHCLEYFAFVFVPFLVL